MSDYYLGEIRLMASAYAPTDWHVCDGSLLSVQTYQALFALLGTTYGGDGVKTFGIPDLQGRLPIGMGQGNGLTARTLGQKAGTETVSLTVEQIPAHTHSLITAGTPASTPTPGNAVTFANTAPPTIQYVKDGASGTTTVQLGDATIGNNTSNSMPHANVMPCAPIIYMICVNGIYPNRN